MNRRVIYFSGEPTWGWLESTPSGYANHSLRLTKERINRNLDARSLSDAIALEDRQQVMMLLSEDFQEGVAAFREKRAPQYRDR